MKIPRRLIWIVVVSALLLPWWSLAASVNVTWDPVTKDIGEGDESVAYYMIYYGETARSSEMVNPSDGNPYDFSYNAGQATEAQIDDLESGKSYYFSVVAVDYGNNSSDYSDEIRYDVSAGGGTDNLNGGCNCSTSSVEGGILLLVGIGWWLRRRFVH